MPPVAGTARLRTRKWQLARQRIHSQARTLSYFAFFPRNFEEKKRLLAVYRNSSQITGELLATVKMCEWINLAIIGIFHPNKGTVKRASFVTQIAIKNIQCRTGVRPTL